MATNPGEDYYIHVLTPDKMARSVEVKTSILTIGRDPNNDLVLDDANVSRWHARVEFDGRDHKVVDLRAESGTYLDGVKLLPGVPEEWLPGKILQIAQSRLHLKQGKPQTDEAEEIILPPHADEIIFASHTESKIEIYLETPHLTVIPGGATTASLILVNHGTTVASCQIAVSGIAAEWLPATSPVLQLLPNMQKAVKLLIQPPRSVYVQVGHHPLTFRVLNSETQSQLTEVEATLIIGGVDILVETPQLSVLPGATVAASLILVNHGSTVELCQVSVTGIPNKWLQLTTPNLQLAPGIQKRVEFIIQPPRSPSSGAGKYPLMIQVLDQGTLSPLAETSLALTINSYSHFESHLKPEQMEARQTAQVIVENQGNIPQTFNLKWQDVVDELVFEPAQHEVTMTGGQVTAIEFRAIDRQRRLIGGRRGHGFSVQVRSSEGGVQEHKGEFISRGQISPILLSLLLFGCLVLAMIPVFIAVAPFSKITPTPNLAVVAPSLPPNTPTVIPLMDTSSTAVLTKTPTTISESEALVFYVHPSKVFTLSVPRDWVIEREEGREVFFTDHKGSTLWAILGNDGTDLKKAPQQFIASIMEHFEIKTYEITINERRADNSIYVATNIFNTPDSTASIRMDILFRPIDTFLYMMVFRSSEYEKLKPTWDKIMTSYIIDDRALRRLDSQPAAPPEEAPSPTPTPLPTPFARVVDEEVNLRSGPGANYQKIGQVQQGDQLLVIGRNDTGDWWQVVTLIGKEGWVKGDFVEIENNSGVQVVTPPPPPSPPPSPAGGETIDAICDSFNNPAVWAVCNEIQFVLHGQGTDVDCASRAGLKNLVALENTNVIGPRNGDFKWENDSRCDPPKSGQVLFKKINGALFLIREESAERFCHTNEPLALVEALRMFETGEIKHINQGVWRLGECP